ncbi:MAG: acyltransferase [Tidjanibacter sp.]|nr:acyltransferase [Tidjanibacter sp.]
MRTIEEITAIATAGEFDDAAMELFRFQARRCEPYRRYLELLGVNPYEVIGVDQIPFLPIELFRTHKVYSGEGEPEKIFTSSSTGGSEPSRHYMARLADYEQCFLSAYRQFYGSMPIYALLPCYLSREGSSLVYMVNRLVELYGGGFFLDNHDELLERLRSDPRQKILLGVSYALLDLVEECSPQLSNTIVMETGGMKGRRRELPKEELHRILCEGFGVSAIHSEYGMAELSSQAYSAGGGVFRTPSWLRVEAREQNNPLERLPHGVRGAIDIIDLGNRSSCAFIATQDVGTVFDDGSFRLSGRVEGSPVRGCNLLIE